MSNSFYLCVCMCVCMWVSTVDSVLTKSIANKSDEIVDMVYTVQCTSFAPQLHRLSDFCVCVFSGSPTSFPLSLSLGVFHSVHHRFHCEFNWKFFNSISNIYFEVLLVVYFRILRSLFCHPRSLSLSLSLSSHSPAHETLLLPFLVRASVSGVEIWKQTFLLYYAMLCVLMFRSVNGREY